MQVGGEHQLVRRVPLYERGDAIGHLLRIAEHGAGQGPLHAEFFVRLPEGFDVVDRRRNLPGRPRRRLTKLCCWLVNRRRDSASLSLATTFRASIACGWFNVAEGRNLGGTPPAPRPWHRARSARQTHRAGPSRRPCARRTGWTPGSRSAPQATARNRLHRLPGLYRLEVVQQLAHVLRELVGAVEVAAQCARGGLIGARRTAEAEIDAVRIQRSQRAELLGHLQRRMVGHDAAPTRMRRCRPTRRSARPWPRWRCRACCGVRPASNGGSRIGVLGQFQHVGEGGGGVTALQTGARSRIDNGIISGFPSQDPMGSARRSGQ